MKMRSTLVAAALLCLVAANALAQETQHVSFKAPAENSKYIQQLAVDVGDVPNHVVRTFEIRFTYPNNAPVINGVRLVEAWGRGIADYIDGNGSGTVYNVFVMENGDRFFARVTRISWRTPDKLFAPQIGFITGGTGKLAGIRGNLRASTNFDYKVGFNETQIDIDYSIGK
jgi:hypothetical protein